MGLEKERVGTLLFLTNWLGNSIFLLFLLHSSEQLHFSSLLFLALALYPALK